MRLDFAHQYQYYYWQGTYHPMLWIEIGANGLSYPTYAILDSGADYCLFSEVISTDLGLKLEDGRPDTIGGVGGDVRVYFHDISITFEHGDTVHLEAAFSNEIPDDFTMQLIGRAGVFDEFRFAFQERDHVIHLQRE